MKKGGILNPSLIGVLAALGHTDALVVCDAGLPVPDGPKRVDVSLVPGIPRFTDTVRAILAEFCVESALVAEEMVAGNTGIYKELVHMLGDTPVRMVPHKTLKDLSREAKALVRTGETTPYANVILYSGIKGVFRAGEPG
ncbi:MAG: D-ribose pyranase [Firmicutes bacterium]|nr:D-ribose pyranase [Bacillota bacterium]